VKIFSFSCLGGLIIKKDFLIFKVKREEIDHIDMILRFISKTIVFLAQASWLRWFWRIFWDYWYGCRRWFNFNFFSLLFWRSNIFLLWWRNRLLWLRLDFWDVFLWGFLIMCWDRWWIWLNGIFKSILELLNIILICQSTLHNIHIRQIFILFLQKSRSRLRQRYSFRYIFKTKQFKEILFRNFIIFEVSQQYSEYVLSHLQVHLP
jgi:hypothetical protein